MKVKLNYKSKKFIISVVIIAILLILAVTGITLLIKSNSTASAATETASNASDKVDDTNSDEIQAPEDGETNVEDVTQDDDQGTLNDINPFQAR